MGRVCKFFVVAVVMSTIIVLEVSPAFALSGGDFPLETFACETAPGHSDTLINLGTGIVTPSEIVCVPADSVGSDDDDVVIE